MTGTSITHAMWVCVLVLAWTEAVRGQPIGPDVVVAEVAGYSASDILEFPVVGDIVAYSIETTSCNYGDADLNWRATSNQHPVISQNMYRLKDGRFEQIGQAWLKHAFYALSYYHCFSDCQATNGSTLGVHCSDPYSANINGMQYNLGPKSEVNATNGVFIYPFCYGGWCPPSETSAVTRRLQVRVEDIDPALNPGAFYFIESQYVAPDDAAAGNGGNNSSWREIMANSISNLAIVGQTHREAPAIFAWAEKNPNVVLSQMTVANEGGPGMDGIYWVGANVEYVGAGWWRYEYAVQNVNSNRAGRGFNVPIKLGTNVANVGFHAVAYHSGELYDTADWTVIIGDDSVTWRTESHSMNPNANALRWDTLYNFWMDVDEEPVDDGMVVLDLFEPAIPASISAITKTPTPTPACACPGDVDRNNRVDGDDIAPFLDLVLAEFVFLPLSRCVDLAPPFGDMLDLYDVELFVISLLEATPCDDTIQASAQPSAAWLYENLLGGTDCLVAFSVANLNDPLQNTSYTYEWTITPPPDQPGAAFTTISGGGTAQVTLAAPARPGYSGGGLPYAVRCVFTGDQFGNQGEDTFDVYVRVLADVDGDGCASAGDAGLILQVEQGIITDPEIVRAADVNCDGMVDVQDRQIAQAIAQDYDGNGTGNCPAP